MTRAGRRTRSRSAGGALTIKTYTEAGEHYCGMIASVASAGLEQTHGYFEARV